jgi:uncharacterized membrane protein YdjX (TVP38/TMEM64 family)
MVTLLRMSPLVPYNFFNYIMAVTSVKTKHFIFGSIGMIPISALYSFIGANLNSI